LLVTEPPVSFPPAVTVKLRTPTGVAAEVVIVRVVVFDVPDPVKVVGEKVATVPVGAPPPTQSIVQLPVHWPFDFVSVMVPYVMV